MTENFDYADGNLTNNAAWTAHSGGGSVPITVTSSAVILSHGSGSREDVNTTFTTKNSGILSAQFSLMVSDDVPIAGTDFEYFAHFGTGGGASMRNFVSKLDVVSPTDSGNFDFTLGISASGGTAEISYGTDFSFGAIIAVFLEFDVDTGQTSLTVDGGATVMTSTPANVGLDLAAFALRQSDSTADEIITIDSLVISHAEAVPEPSSTLGLFGLLLTGLALRKR